MAQKLTTEHGLPTRFQFRTQYNQPFERTYLQTPTVLLKDGDQELKLMLIGTTNEKRSWPDPTAGYPIHPVYMLDVSSSELKIGLFTFSLINGNFSNVYKMNGQPPTMRDLKFAGELLAIMQNQLTTTKESTAA